MQRVSTCAAKSPRTALPNPCLPRLAPLDCWRADCKIQFGGSGCAANGCVYYWQFRGRTLAHPQHRGVNTAGELIGINSQILSPSGGNIGIGFAIPANMMRDVLDQLVKDGRVRRGVLGVTVQPLTPDLASAFKLKNHDGVLVSDVQTGSAAERAGIRRGDVITGINGEKVDRPTGYETWCHRCSLAQK